jgi:hypothetical protein
MLPVPGFTCGVPVDFRMARTWLGVRVVPRCLAMLDSEAATAATIGPALDVPPKVDV